MPAWIGGFDRTDESNAIKPVAEYQDPVNKMRVSTPQSLIDTDFEYGLQPTKWDAVTLSNNRPTLFYDPTTPLAVTAIARTANRIITVSTTTPPAVGSFVYIQETLNPVANGWWMVETVVAGTSFTYTIPVDIAAGALLDATKTYVFRAFPYSGAAIFVDTSVGAAFTNVGTTVTCQTTARIQGVHVGMTIAVNGTTAATSDPPNGNWVVSRVTANNSFEFVVLTAPVGAITASAGNTNTLFVRPNSFSTHRPFDGGVQFSAGAGTIGNQLIRQTRRYFRYQSGKGIQFSTGTSLAPALYPDSITRATSRLFTFSFRFSHELSAGAEFVVENWTPAAINGIWTVQSTPSDTSLQAVRSDGSSPDVPFAQTFWPSTTNPVSRVLPLRWYGSQNRVGMFDLQNGVFFEFDGQELAIVRRSSVNQISGTVAAAVNDSLITGTNTSFSTQLRVNENIVIRGMTYRVESIISDTSMHVSPLWRAASAQSNMIVTRTVDLRIPQSQWNIDKMDGTGPSGYRLDITRMQMIYIDYSWYGAGFVRYGFRASDGTVRFCHRILNNNVNTEAYMRSGNLPAHYESSTMPVTAVLASSLANTNVTAINVDDASRFPPSGTVRVRATATNGAVEYISYTSRTNTSLVGLTRGLAQGATATTFTLTGTNQIPVELVSPTSAAAVSHWGSSVIMDGRYDDDQSFVFNQANINPIQVPFGAERVLMSLRLGPSVDNGIPSVVGAREIINRMQLKLRSIGFISSGSAPLRFRLVLNGGVAGSPASFVAVGGSSLCQVAVHTSAVTIATATPGEPIAAYFLNVSGGANFTTTTAELTLVRDLGNSILGGGLNNTVPTGPTNMYPDGPDVLHVVVSNTSGTVNSDVACRLSWTEAQA
jgi:hypothetical protein